jgi:cleavage and polyadenylation specificity factor subunit 1
MTDVKSKRSFLIDTGAEYSILTPTTADINLGAQPTNVEHFVAANGSIIPIYGKRNILLNFGHKNYTFTFTVAGVNKDIIGCDLLHGTGLLVDIKNAHLWDPATKSSLKGAVYVVEPPPHYKLYSIILDENESTEYRILLDSFPEITAKFTDIKKSCQTTEHSMIVKAPPFRMKFRPLAPDKEEIAKKEFLEMEQLGIIHRGHGQWASPLHMVRKKNGSWRPCGDYRRLNSITVHDSYPLPLIASFTNRLEGTTIFSKVDLVRAYNQIPMSPNDIEKNSDNHAIRLVGICANAFWFAQFGSKFSTIYGQHYSRFRQRICLHR